VLLEVANQVRIQITASQGCSYKRFI
jgi:hypothetical protein